MQGELKRSLKPFPKEHDSFTEWELGAGGGGGGVVLWSKSNRDYSRIFQV